MVTRTSKGPIHKIIPEGDSFKRNVCLDCGYIAYDNPKIVSGAICVWENKILLCKRAIEPRKTFWTIPAGFLELNETTEQGAKREVWEEARANITVTGLVGVYQIPRISQIYFIYKADMVNANFAPGPESENVVLSDYEDIPWNELAFSSIRWALEIFHKNDIPRFETHPS